MTAYLPYNENLSNLKDRIGHLNTTHTYPPCLISFLSFSPQNNTNELADALRELEASTAALGLEFSTDPPESSNNSTKSSSSSSSQQTASSSASSATNHRLSLQCSSGYGTMTNSPSCSQDTIATMSLNTTQQTHGEQNKK